MKKPKPETKVRVIRDTRDATKDYWLHWQIARKLYYEGILAFDLTNNCYCEKNS